MLQNFNKWEYLIAATLLCVVVVRYPVDSLRAWFELCFRVGLGFLFAYWLYSEVNEWAGLLLGVAVVSHVLPNYTEESYLALDRLMIGLAFYALIVKKCNNVDILINAIACVAVIQVIFVIFQGIGIDSYKTFFRFMSCSATAEGLMANRNESSAFLAISSAAFFRKKWLFLLLILLPGIYFSIGFGGYLGFAGALICFSMFKANFLINLIILILVWDILLFVSGNVDAPGYKPRFDAWLVSFKIWKKHWLFTGCGLGNWKVEFPYLYKSGLYQHGFIRLHNTFLQGLIEIGPAFIGITFGYLFSIIKKCKDIAIPTSAIVSIIIMANINTVERMNHINLMLIILWLAIFQIKVNQKEKKQCLVTT